MTSTTSEFSDEFADSVEVPYPAGNVDPPNAIQQARSQMPPSLNKTRLGRKHRILLTSIVASILIVAALVTWVAITLVRNKNDGIPNEEDLPSVDNLNPPIVGDASNTDSQAVSRDIGLSLFFCPEPGDPLNIDLTDNAIAYNSVEDTDQHQGRILITKSSKGILCTLVEVDADPDAGDDLRLKPIGRSYNGNGWEPYHALHSSSHTVPLSCSDSDDSKDCLITLPPLQAGRKYILKSYEHSLAPRDEAARFLESTTFGPTTSEINAFVASGGKASEWVKNQLDLPTIGSHRQFYRSRATNFHPETTWMGTLSFKACQAGARYRKFVFVPKDNGRTLTIETSPIDANYRILMVEGEIRSVIPGRVKRYVSENNLPVVPDGSYEICSVKVGTSVGEHIAIKVGTNCGGIVVDGVFGNPIVKFDEQHMSLVKHLVAIDGSAMPVMEDFFPEGTEILELTSDVTDGGCTTQETTGAPEVVTIASYGNEFWIHTPSFRLMDNQMETPLMDGGKAAVEATANAPYDRMKVHCSNAPRTFLNEKNCVLSDNACSFQNKTMPSTAIVCGSPYEVASSPDPDTGSLDRGSFDIATRYNKTLPQGQLETQKETVWLEIALHGKDQLRQRMAWALSQILVVSPFSIDNTKQTESFLTYYDIFVRNAFGNYFDILKEVTYSPLMAEMLTYNKGVSTGHAWITKEILHHADENYARELLQLFSIGLYRLNDDGTVETSANGHEIRTYTNQDISEYAKVFVGFKKQFKRGNIEDMSAPGERNDIDPLQIIPEHKDHFPKLGINNRYVGDGYPLCMDIPSRNFLKKGATFRLLGSNPNPELLNEPAKWWPSDPARLSLDEPSLLSSILCNKGSGNRCVPKMKVVLDSDIECYGVECTTQELRAFEVFKGSDVWFEYIRPPCVNHAFYDSAQSIRRRWGENGHAMCGQPDTYAASTVCCEVADTSSDTPIKQELFSGERVPLHFAEKRCSSLSTVQEPCHNPFPNRKDCKNNGGCDNLGTYYWSSSGCFITAKVNQDGKVAVIHNPQIEGVDTYKMITNDTEMFFHVDWISDDTDSFISDLVSDCTSSGCINGDDNTCICPTSVHETTAFVSEDDLLSIDSVLSIATIGAIRHTEETFYPINGFEGLSKYPQGTLSSETVFKVIDSNSEVHFRKNTKNSVHLGTGAGKFRNPVTFYSLSEPTTRDAAYETDAALRHAFFHQNMAPFISFRLAQRFGVSNPSPRYVRNISRAFRSGLYIHSSTGMRIGSSQYGCLRATIAAVLLDDEALDPVLDADPAHGSIQEPYLKIVRVLRSLEFRSTKSHPLLTINTNLQLLIGQQSHQLPNVFSFFRPEYQPAGRVSSAGMVSPESQVLSGPTSVQMTNVILSLLKYGANKCYGGFGDVQNKKCKIGVSTRSAGNTSYDPERNGVETATELVNDLSTLLTSGRLDKSKREIIKEAFEETITRGKSLKEAMINAQQLVVASPEFHATNLGYTIGQKRSSPVLSQPSNIPSNIGYKAVVFVTLLGGYDSFNVLVPKECEVTNTEGKTVRDQYLEQRGSVAFNEADGEFDLDINATDSNQPCSRFAIHDELQIVKDLYDAGDLAFFANAGVINNAGLTKKNYHKLTRSQLFAHNAMQREVTKVDPYDKIVGTGIMGRAKDILSKNGHVVGTISIDNPSIAVDGMQGKSQPATIIGRTGSKKFATRPEDEFDFDIEKYTRTLNSQVDQFSGIFSETWSEKFITGMDEAEEYESIFDQAKLDESIWTKYGSPNYADKSKVEQEHWEKWSSLSKLIQEKDLRNVDRDLFFTSFRGWDHHDEMKIGLREQLYALNYGLEMFVKQAKSSGFWNEVAVVITSDFGRTLTPNSNAGTDHGWGGHYMILGGDVKGGQILGDYPSDLTPNGLLVDDRGRFLPTTSWDSIWNGILQWVGVSEETDLDYCLPNRFSTIDPVVGVEKSLPLLTADSMFKSQERSEGWNLRGRKE